MFAAFREATLKRTSRLAILVLLSVTITGVAASRVAIAGGPLVCEDGSAGPYPCADVDLQAFMTLAELGGGPDTKAANLWGWTDPQTSKEYVLLGLTDQTAFVDVSDPMMPEVVGSLPTHTTSSKYRDIKIYQDHAFIIADLPSLHGMQVFDLTQLRDVTTPPETFAETAHFDGFGDAHNLYINTDSGFAYVVRTTTPELCSGAVYMVDIRDPVNPAFAGCIETGGLASDSICVIYQGDDPDYQGREVCIVASDDNILVADATDKSNPVDLASLGYTDITRAHNAWLTPDHNYFVSADMNDELETGLNTRIFVWDFRDVDDPQLIGIYDGPTVASDHNVWVAGNEAFVGNFRAGLRILDLTDIASGVLDQEAFFDMIPEDDNPGHSGGAWAVYAYFPSGLIAVSDKEAGLYLLTRTTPQAAVVASVDFEYSMDDGSVGAGQYSLYDDATVIDDAGATGRWSIQTSPLRVIVRYTDGSNCEAASAGRLVSAGQLRGPRVCRDDSGVRGFWRGTLSAPNGVIGID